VIKKQTMANITPVIIPSTNPTIYGSIIFSKKGGVVLATPPQSYFLGVVATHQTIAVTATSNSGMFPLV